MDNIKIWVYLIIGGVYVVSWFLKKSREAAKNQPTKPTTRRDRDFQDTEPYSERPKQLTFEELLQEITQGKQPAPRPVVQPQTRQTEYVDYDDDLKDEEEDLEDVSTDYRRKNNVYEVYEKAKSDAFNRPSLEETMKVEDTVVKFSKFKVFEEEKGRNLLEEYTRDLQDPEGFKKALVLSEILNRRF